MTNLPIESSSVRELTGYMPEHTKMLEKIEANLPEIARSTSFFGKSQSHFMDTMLTVNHPTPLRNIRQILAEIQKSKTALEEASISNRKREIEIKMLKRDFEQCEDDLKKELILVEIEEKKAKINSSQVYISGAIRKIANYIDQYNSILKSIGIEHFNEIDFEKEEEKYHIKKAFWQGVIAARCRNGVIDEGNQIYLNEIGINGGTAQAYVSAYLAEEVSLLQSGKEPGHEMFISFLENMAKKFQGCSARYVKAKGMSGTYTAENLLTEGDVRLIEERIEE